MKTITVNTDVYQFAELSEDAKQKAIEWYREGNYDFDSNREFIIEDAKECGKLIGIDIDNIYFSGFYSQGDGACFEGSYQYNKGALKLIKEFAPLDTDLHDITQRLQSLQTKNFFGLLAYVKHSGRYNHEMCTRINVEHNLNRYVSDNDEQELTDILRDFMRWIYSRLDAANDYCNLDSTIIENIESNEYEFTIEGERY
jgi:hypothetical protein